MAKKTKLLCLASLFAVAFTLTYYKSRIVTNYRIYKSPDDTIDHIPITVIGQVKDNIFRTELVNSTVTPKQGKEEDNNSDKMILGRFVSEKYSCKPVVPRLSTESLPITGLVSFPGAGNTWARHLLQQVSG